MKNSLIHEIHKENLYKTVTVRYSYQVENEDYYSFISKIKSSFSLTESQGNLLLLLTNNSAYRKIKAQVLKFKYFLRVYFFISKKRKYLVCIFF